MRTSDYSQHVSVSSPDPSKPATFQWSVPDRRKFYRPFGQQYDELKMAHQQLAEQVAMEQRMQLVWLTDFHAKTKQALDMFDASWGLNNRVGYDDTDGDVARRTIGFMAEALELMKHKAITNAEDASQWRDLSDGYRADRDRLQRQLDNQLWNRIKRGFKRLFEYPGKLVQGPPGPQGPMGPPGHSCQCLECNPQRDNGPF